MMHPARQAYVEEDDLEVSSLVALLFVSEMFMRISQSAACLKLETFAWGDRRDPG